MKALLLAAAGLLFLHGAPDFDNPDYQRWAPFKVGSWTKMKSEIDNNGNKMALPTELTTTLIEVDEHKAVVEEALVNTMLPKDSPKQEKPKRRTYQAKTKKAETIEEEGDEELEVGGKKLACHWVKSTPPGGSKKAWLSSEVPGKVVRLEIGTAGLTGVQRLRLTAWEKK